MNNGIQMMSQRFYKFGIYGKPADRTSPAFDNSGSKIRVDIDGTNKKHC